MIIDTNFQTPPSVCDYMAGLVPEHAKTILEPTPGIGNLVRALESKSKYQVMTADDFFLFDTNQKFDCIVS